MIFGALVRILGSIGFFFGFFFVSFIFEESKSLSLVHCFCHKIVSQWCACITISLKMCSICSTFERNESEPAKQVSSHRLIALSFSFRSETCKAPSVRSPLGTPEENTIKEKSCVEGFVFFLLSSDHIASAVSSMLPTDASRRHCHSFHNL